MENKVLGALRSAHEEEYFQRKNEEALQRIRSEQARTRLSPVAGVPMVQETLMGVVIDRCPKSGGVWLDAGELEQLLSAQADLEGGGDKSNIFSEFISALTKFK
jgi:hypothetical protein